MNMKKMALVLAASAGLSAGSAMAATDGTVGATSQGDFDITLQIRGEVLINGLEDVTFGAPLASGDLLGGTNHCVASTASANKYVITAASDNPNGSEFRMQQGASGNFVKYSVFYKSADEVLTGLPGDEIKLDQGAFNNNGGTGFTGASTTASCNSTDGADNATIWIQVLATDANAAATNPGDYTDTLTLTVAPI